MDSEKYDKFNTTIDSLVEEILDVPNSDGSKSRKVKGSRLLNLRTSVEKLVRDSGAIRVNRARRNYASIRKGKDAYTKDRYGIGLSYRIHVKRAYEGMIALGYLREAKKGVSLGARGLFLTRYIATDKLLDLLSEPHSTILPVLFPPEKDNELIRVQQTIQRPSRAGRRPMAIKELIDYEDTPTTIAMRERLERINKVLLQNWYDLELTDPEFDTMQAELKSKEERERGTDPHVNLANRTLYRVFTDATFTRGGRFYGGWWQTIPSRYRSRILINSKRTVEFDYSGLHPAILYAEAGRDLPDDPYDGILAPQHRDLVKKAFNAMVNAKHELTRPPYGLVLRETGMTWRQLSSAIREKHQPISDAFYSNVGTHLQFIDSELAERVLLHFTQRPLNAAVLPVHDSFIMHHGYETDLRTVMDKFFTERFGRSIRLKAVLDRMYSTADGPKEPPEKGKYRFVTDDVFELFEYFQVGHEQRWTNFRS